MRMRDKNLNTNLRATIPISYPLKPWAIRLKKSRNHLTKWEK